MPIFTVNFREVKVIFQGQSYRYRSDNLQIIMARPSFEISSIDVAFPQILSCVKCDLRQFKTIDVKMF